MRGTPEPLDSPYRMMAESPQSVIPLNGEQNLASASKGASYHVKMPIVSPCRSGPISGDVSSPESDKVIIQGSVAAHPDGSRNVFNRSGQIQPETDRASNAVTKKMFKKPNSTSSEFTNSSVGREGPHLSSNPRNKTTYAPNLAEGNARWCEKDTKDPIDSSGPSPRQSGAHRPPETAGTLQEIAKSRFRDRSDEHSLGPAIGEQSLQEGTSTSLAVAEAQYGNKEAQRESPMSVMPTTTSERPISEQYDSVSVGEMFQRAMVHPVVEVQTESEREAPSLEKFGRRARKQLDSDWSKSIEISGSSFERMRAMKKILRRMKDTNAYLDSDEEFVDSDSSECSESSEKSASSVHSNGPEEFDPFTALLQTAMNELNLISRKEDGYDKK